MAAAGAAAGGLVSDSFRDANAAQVHSTKALAPAAKPSSLAGPLMKLAEMLGLPESRLWRLVKQCGADHVVGTFSRSGETTASSNEKPWGYAALERLKKAYDDGGFELAVIESRPPMDKIKLALPGRDEQIEDVCELIRNLGKLHVPVWCYEWMPVNNWTRTSSEIRGRGGALVTGFDLGQFKTEPVTQYGKVTEENLWANLKYFLERVVPVAEKANVKLAMHPDDPPLSPLRGLPRIMRSVENYQRLLDLVPSEVNGITLCQGNFTLMTNDLPGVIRKFGKQKKIFFVHFRDVRGTPEKFVETFHDNGQTDMVACMRAYREVGFDGVCRPDHVPTLDGDSNERPGYSTIGRLFALGYIRGLVQSVYSETSEHTLKP